MASVPVVDARPLRSIDDLVADLILERDELRAQRDALIAALKLALLPGAEDYDVAEQRRAVVRAALERSGSPAPGSTDQQSTTSGARPLATR